MYEKKQFEQTKQYFNRSNTSKNTKYVKCKMNCLLCSDQKYINRREYLLSIPLEVTSHKTLIEKYIATYTDYYDYYLIILT